MAVARPPAAFRQHDVTRALRAAKAAGYKTARVELDPDSGRVIGVVAGDGPVVEQRDEFEAWKAKHAGEA